jgi:hypothetical protein
MSNCLRKLRQLGLVAIVCCAVLALASAAARAQGFSITNVTKNSASKASFPTMVVDSQGNLNLVWIDSVDGLQFARSTSSANGTALGTPKSIMGPANTPIFPAFQPQMAVYQTQTSVIEITWAAPDPASTAAAPLYDVFAARSNDSGANFVTTLSISGPVALFDSPRLAFDFSGNTNIVWGHDVLISQAQDGLRPPIQEDPESPYLPPITSLLSGRTNWRKILPNPEIRMTARMKSRMRTGMLRTRSAATFGSTRLCPAWAARPTRTRAIFRM